MPIWIVVSFFGAFISMSVSVIVLSGVDSGSSSLVQSSLVFSVGNVESHVSVSGLAVSVVSPVFVHSVEQSSGSLSNGSVGIVGDGVGGFSISYEVNWVSISSRAHVLNDEVANQLWVFSTSVLSGPFNSEQRFFIEGHFGSPAITSLSIVLRVEQSVGIVSVGVGFIQTVV